MLSSHFIVMPCDGTAMIICSFGVGRVEVNTMYIYIL